MTKERRSDKATPGPEGHGAKPIMPDQGESGQVRPVDALGKSEERWQFALGGQRGRRLDWNVQTNEVYFSAQWKEMLRFP